MLSPFQLRAELYDSPEWKLRGKDSLSLLAECRFRKTPEYLDTCRDETFWRGLVTIRYTEFIRQIPEHMGWKEWFAFLTLGKRALVGLKLGSSPQPMLGLFDSNATLENVIHWFLGQVNIDSGELRIFLPSGTVTQVSYDQGKIIGLLKGNRKLEDFQGAKPIYHAEFLIEIL